MSTDWIDDGGRRAPVRQARRSDGAQTMTSKSRLPSMSWRFAVAVIGVGSTIAVALFASSASGPVPVALSGWAGPSYAKDVTGFHPLTNGLVADLSPRTTTAPPRPVTVPVSVSNPGAPSSHQPQGAPTVTPATPPPTVTPPSPTPGPPQPSLSIAFSAGSTKTHANGTIVYTIRVTNAGPGDATSVVIQSHVPDGTTLSGWSCNGATVKAGRRTTVECGATATTLHPVAFGVASLAAGADVVERFWVTVNHDVLRHTDLTDHAHVYAHDVDPVDSEPASVLVP